MLRYPRTQPQPQPPRLLALAERILELLDQGRFTATYKYAVPPAADRFCRSGLGV